MPTILTGIRPLLPALLGSALLLAAACSEASTPAALAFAHPDGRSGARALADPARELLELAAAAAAAVPADPHQKTRTRLLHAVASACLELGDTESAQRYGERIDDWRRGCVFAELAWHHALHGDATLARQHAEKASGLAERALHTGDQQEWRRERVRGRLAGVWALLGALDQAEALERDVGDAEWGTVVLARAHRADAAGRRALAAELTDAVRLGVFDRTRAALRALAVLYDRGFADRAERDALRVQVLAAGANLPANVRLEAMTALARHALAHGDQAEARRLLAAAAPLATAGPWPLDLETAWRARLAALRHHAGEAAAARTELTQARARFETERTKIADVDHADALRPCAEAWHAVGEPAAALDAYRATLAAGLQNPNSRPRAEDLAATCLSLATRGVEPDADLWSRLRGAVAGLGHPW